MIQRGLAAVTGATGFLGRHLVAALAAEGFKVRVLARRDPASPDWRHLHVEAVLGDLADLHALARLTEGADVVVHAAGATKAADLDGFLKVNRDGALRVAEAAGAAHMVLVSSLAAREPALSAYAASKRAGEDAAAARLPPGRLTVVRPPAIYGPGDLEMLPLFRLAKGPMIPLLGPPEARLAMIHALDAAKAIAALAANPRGGTFAVADDRPEGYLWREVAETAAKAVGGRPLIWQAPAFAAPLAGKTADLAARLTARPTVFSSGKAQEMRHFDWSVHAGELAEGLPAPHFGLLRGFQDTVSWATTRRLI